MTRAPRSRSVIGGLVAVFVIVHAVLAVLALAGPGDPLGDVVGVYRFWVETGLTEGRWVGIDTLWVYPILALPPMLLASVFGTAAIGPTWVGLVTLVDAALFAGLLRRVRTPRDAVPVAWWLGFLLALGPVAVGRIDALVAPLVAAGLLVLARRPALSGVLLTAAAWMKVWPAALVAVAALVSRGRARVVAGAAGFTAAVLVVVIALGGARSVLGFLTEQSDRGLQVEAPLATPLLWGAAAGGPWRVAWSPRLLTFQIEGPGVTALAAATTPALVVAVLALLVLGLLALRRGAAPAAVLAPLALGVTVALIVANKVGSPQFIGWLAAPVLLGLVLAARGRGSAGADTGADAVGGGGFRIPALLALVSAALTQAVYPSSYDAMLALQPAALLALTARNLVDLAILAVAVAGLVRLIRQPAAGPATELRTSRSGRPG
ncbi:MAG: DUF2029 domain-containing protein [Actinomycetales bacterium]|nr:DUF2029 domain-containing protein [Actinomycetales bacterium]